jgi:hypothetical protein
MVEVHEVDTMTALDIALDQLHEAMFELRTASPDLGHVEMHLEVAAIYLSGAVDHG